MCCNMDCEQNVLGSFNRRLQQGSKNCGRMVYANLEARRHFCGDGEVRGYLSRAQDVFPDV